MKFCSVILAWRCLCHLAIHTARTRLPGKWQEHRPTLPQNSYKVNPDLPATSMRSASSCTSGFVERCHFLEPLSKSLRSTSVCRLDHCANSYRTLRPPSKQSYFKHKRKNRKSALTMCRILRPRLNRPT